MQYAPIDAAIRNLEQKINAQFDERIDALNQTIDNLTVEVVSSSGSGQQYQASPNILRNSSMEWSTMAWDNAGITPATAGDTNHECKWWSYHLATETDLTAGSPLIASAHSGFGALDADAPVWGREDGSLLIGGSGDLFDVSAPLPTDAIFPGLKLYIYFEASLTNADADINDTEVYCGFWDNTTGQQKWIEGGAFTPGISVYGVPGSRTLEYKVHARTDSGNEILSAAVTVTTAPSTLTTDNHVRLSFTGAPGFIQYTIYRKDGSNYYRVGDIRNSIDLQFYDVVESGPTVVPVSGYPSVSSSKPQAYARTLGFSPGSPGNWRAHTMAVQVPTTYDRSLTGNLQQYFRLGLTGLVASGSERKVAIRRIAVSEGYGGWSRSSFDLAALSGPSTTTASGGVGGNPGGDPPGGGDGGPVCLVLDTLIDVPEGQTELENIEQGSKTVCGGQTSRVKRTQDGVVQFVWRIGTANGAVNECSDEHRWPTTKRNRAARFLKIGDELLDRDDNPTKIVSKEKRYPTEEERLQFGGIPVRRIWLPKPHLFVANGIKTLNLKPVDGLT